MTAWGHLLTDTITVASRTGVSSYGDPTYGSQSTLLARVEHVSKLVVGTDGNELKADHVCVVASEVPITSRVWLPGDNTASVDESRRVLAVKKASLPATTGDTMFEVYL